MGFLFKVIFNISLILIPICHLNLSSLQKTKNTTLGSLFKWLVTAILDKRYGILPYTKYS